MNWKTQFHLWCCYISLTQNEISPQKEGAPQESSSSKSSSKLRVLSIQISAPRIAFSILMIYTTAVHVRTGILAARLIHGHKDISVLTILLQLLCHNFF